MRHIISVLLENEPGALSRVVGLFSQRNYNIETLTVAATEDPTLSRLTLTTKGHEDVIEQITKNLNKLIEVVKLFSPSLSGYLSFTDSSSIFTSAPETTLGAIPMLSTR